MSRSIVLIIAVFAALLGAWFFLMGPADTDAPAPADTPIETPAPAAN